MNIKYLILPLVDNSSINSLKEEKELIQVLKKKIFPKLHKLKILFETDYKPTDVLTFIRKFKSNKVGINYDTGNSASLNYKIDDEKKYFHHVKNIHIKDRLKYGKTIRLGKGNWDYISFFKLIKKLNYKGFLILQTARAKKKQHVTELNINRKFLLRYL
jgi:L-ribulose-5-phosphate 3-epimerase